MAALRAASLQGVLAIRRSHADAKAVRLLAVAVIRLVGPFHGSKSSLVD